MVMEIILTVQDTLVKKIENDQSDVETKTEMSKLSRHGKSQ